MRSLVRSLTAPAFLLACCVSGAVQAASERDPWEGFNRKVYAFNDFLDRYLAKPVAQGYRKVTPGFVDRSVTRFFGNLHDMVDVVDYALQGELVNSRDNLLRVVGNSTIGLGGLLDPASAGGIANRDTDFGITLGKWGVGSGNYLVLPFLGPSTLRDAAGIPVDWTTNPLPLPWTALDDEGTRHALELLATIDQRADLLDVEEAVIGDRYVFLRDIYLQHRDFAVHGGAASDPFLDDPVDEEPAAP